MIILTVGITFKNPVCSAIASIRISEFEHPGRDTFARTVFSPLVLESFDGPNEGYLGSLRDVEISRAPDVTRNIRGLVSWRVVRLSLLILLE